MPRKQYTIHYIYKITNLLNEKYYIGMHSTFNLDDGYMGSGKYIKNSIRRYGIENFKKEILEFLPDRDSLKKREKEIVNAELIGDKNCMNLTIGGEGGPAFAGKTHSEDNRKKFAEQHKGRVPSMETRQKLSNAGKGRIVSDETKKKLSERAKQRFVSDEERQKISVAVKKMMTDEMKKRISDSMRKTLESKRNNEIE